MKLKLTEGEIREMALACGSAEWISEDECVIDVYDGDSPATFDIVLRRDGVYADGAFYMKFDEQEDGWYVDREISDPDGAEAILRSLLS